MSSDDLSRLRNAFGRLVPLVKDHWQQPLLSYAAAVYSSHTSSENPIRTHSFAKLEERLAHRARAEGYSELQLAGLSTELRRNPVLQTGPHCHLVIEPDAFFTHLFSLMGLKSQSSHWHISYSVSTVKFTESAKKGPGWLQLDGQNINVFGLSRSKMVPFSIIGRHSPKRFMLVADDDNAGTRHFSESLRAVLPTDAFASAAEAIKAANPLLWRHAFGAQMNFLQLDDRDVIDLVCDHLRDDNSWLATSLFGDPNLISVFLDAANELTKSPWGGWFSLTTDFFWRLHDGRLRPLKVRDGVLKCALGDFKVPLKPAALLDALEREDIIPNMFLAFIVLSILPGTRVLGGSRQVIYYPLMRQVLLKMLTQSRARADHELANAMLQDAMPGVWGHRTIAPTCPDPWRLVADGGPVVTAELIEYFGRQTLIEAARDLPGFVADPLWLAVATG